MTGSMIVNNLAGLMMLTSLFVISVKSYRLSCGFTPASRWCWCLFRHSLVPVRRRATADLVRQRLYHQSAAGTVNHDLRCTKYSPEHPGKALFGPAMMALLAALIVLLCAFVVQPVKLPMATGLKPALAVALGHFLLGLLCIVSQRNILRQILVTA